MDKKHLTIMFTDIKGFTHRTSHSSRDQLKKLLELHDELICPFFNEFGGTIVKTIGDAFLVTFHSPTDAVLCGMKIQKELVKYNEKQPEDEKLEIRIAINSGEVLVKKDGDVFGEPVNIAARLEGVAEPGDIYFTEAVYLAMNKSEIPTAEIGYRHFKGIPEEVKVYKVLGQEIKKGMFSKKAKPVVRGATVERQLWQTIFMWIGIVFVGLILINILGVAAAVIALISLIGYLIYKFIKKKPRKKKLTWKDFVKWVLIAFVILFLIGIISDANKKTADQDSNIQPTQRQNILDQVNQIKQDAESALIAGDKTAVLEKISQLNEISKDNNNPPELERLISNLEKVLN